MFAVIFVTADFNIRHCEAPVEKSALKIILFTNRARSGAVAIPRKGSALFQSGTAINLLLPPRPRLAGEASRLFAVIFVTADFNIRHCEKRLFFLSRRGNPPKGFCFVSIGHCNRFTSAPSSIGCADTFSPRAKAFARTKPYAFHADIILNKCSQRQIS